MFSDDAMGLFIEVARYAKTILVNLLTELLTLAPQQTMIFHLLVPNAHLSLLVIWFSFSEILDCLVISVAGRLAWLVQMRTSTNF